MEPNMKEQGFADKFLESPLMQLRSYGTTPEKLYLNSLSEPVSLLQSPASSDSPGSFQTNKEETRRKKMKKKSSSFAYRIRDHVKMGPKFSETVKGKLRLGARIIQEGGRENIFKHIFGVREGEELLKASQCYLSTTAGPIAGLLFISTERVAFCSERPITFHSPSGELMRIPYKVSIPVRKIKRANQSENVNKPEQKFIEIVTTDDHEFWFMGFLRYEKAFKNLQKALSLASQ